MTDSALEFYDALLKMGFNETLAMKAANAISFSEIEIVKMRGEMNLMKWMIGFNLFFTIAIFWKVFL